MYGWRRRLGLVVPSSNTTMEPEFWRLSPPGVSVHAARVRLLRVGIEELSRMVDDVVRAAEDLSTAGVDVVLFGCTTGSLLEGPEWERRLREKIERVSGVKAITAAQAVIESLRALGVRKVAVATPYTEELNAREKAFLESGGLRVVRIRGLGISDNIEIGKQPPWVAYRLALDVARGADADGVFISCTNLRTIEVVNALEEELGLPVVTSNTASMWLALRSVGIRDSIDCGKLLREVKTVSY